MSCFCEMKRVCRRMGNCLDRVEIMLGGIEGEEEAMRVFSVL